MKDIYKALEKLEHLRKTSDKSWFDSRKLSSKRLAILDNIIAALRRFEESPNLKILLEIDDNLNNEFNYYYKKFPEILINPKNDLLTDKHVFFAIYTNFLDGTGIIEINDDKKSLTLTIKLDKDTEKLLKKYTLNHRIKLDPKPHIKNALIYSLLNKSNLEILRKRESNKSYVIILHKVHELVINLSRMMVSQDSKVKNSLHQLQIERIKAIQKYATLILPINDDIDYRDCSEGNCSGFSTVFLKKRLYGENPFGIRPNEESPFATLSGQIALNHLAPLTKSIKNSQSKNPYSASVWNMRKNSVLFQKTEDKLHPLLPLVSIFPTDKMLISTDGSPENNSDFWNEYHEQKLLFSMTSKEIAECVMKSIELTWRKCKSNQINIGMDMGILMGEKLQSRHEIAVYVNKDKQCEFVDSTCGGWFKCEISNLEPALIEVMEFYRRHRTYISLELINVYKAKNNPKNIQTPRDTKNYSGHYGILFSTRGVGNLEVKKQRAKINTTRRMSLP